MNFVILAVKTNILLNKAVFFVVDFVAYELFKEFERTDGSNPVLRNANG